MACADASMDNYLIIADPDRSGNEVWNSTRFIIGTITSRSQRRLFMPPNLPSRNVYDVTILAVTVAGEAQEDARIVSAE